MPSGAGLRMGLRMNDMTRHVFCLTNMHYYNVMKSSAVEYLHYDAKAKTLDITFVGGESYRYFDVPNKEFKNYQAAESKGKFVNAEIKPKYRYEKLEYLKFDKRSS